MFFLQKILQLLRGFGAAGVSMDQLLSWIATYWDDLLASALAGWLAGRIVRGRRPDLVASLVAGLLGWLIGAGLRSVLGIAITGLPMILASFLAALIGAMLLWLSAGVLKRA